MYIEVNLKIVGSLQARFLPQCQARRKSKIPYLDSSPVTEQVEREIKFPVQKKKGVRGLRRHPHCLRIIQDFSHLGKFLRGRPGEHIPIELNCI